MFRQIGQNLFNEPGSTCLGFPQAGSEGQVLRSESRGLPSFVSSAPPRSEGEALLRRIFSKGER